MKQITAQILATNELTIGSVMATGGFKGTASYATGPHKGQMIIRTKEAYPTTFAAENRVREIVGVATKAVDPTVKITPLDEKEYLEELKRQFAAENPNFKGS